VVTHILQVHVANDNEMRDSLFWNAMTILAVMVTVEGNLQKDIIQNNAVTKYYYWKRWHLTVHCRQGDAIGGPMPFSFRFATLMPLEARTMY